MRTRESWSDLPEIRPPARHRSILLGVAVGGLLSAILLALGRPSMAVFILVLVVVGAQVTALVPAASRLLERIGSGAAVVVSFVLLGLTQVALLPVWLVTRVLRWDAVESIGGRGRWRPGMGNAGRLVRRGFQRETGPRPLMARLHGGAAAAGTIGLLAGLLAGFVVGGDRLLAGDDEAPVSGGALLGGDPSLVAHEGLPWAEDYFEELQDLGNWYDPYLTWRHADVAGDYLNVQDGVRRSYEPRNPIIDIWFFGGSALLGVGQRDLRTIPSEIARLSEAAGTPARVTNFGVSAYVNWQETLLLTEMLTERAVPDLVVFYGGTNDHALIEQQGPSFDPSILFSDQIEQALIEAEAQVGSRPRPEAEVPEAADLFTVYNRGVALARRLATAYGFEVEHFIAPELQSKEPSPDDRALARDLGQDPEWLDEQGARLDEAASYLAPGVHSLLGALDEVEGPVFFDYAHTNELGARVVAAAMWAELEDKVRDLVGG